MKAGISGGSPAGRGVPARRAVLAICVVAGMLLCGASFYAPAAAYVELYPDRLATSDVAEVCQKLAELGFSCRIAPGGEHVLVPARDRERARSQLAFYHLPRRLQGVEPHTDLLRSLREIPRVEDAWVMVVPERPTENAVEVLLRLEIGQRLEDRDVARVLELVVASIPDTRPDGVRITDSLGNILSTRRMAR